MKSPLEVGVSIFPFNDLYGLLNQIVRELPPEHPVSNCRPLREPLGHTPLQAIHQFGSDFAMIQQLFPNRTRHQIKLKFKIEERKHPLPVHDALLHRSKEFEWPLPQFFGKLSGDLYGPWALEVP
ncbi:hypothetical protein Cni_G00003 [Canna indica]|uniref:Transcription factor TFIIIB component B'' Myb domain-containing protein n=1 Tax=Canna indica TaxID=4628 RepID=A0AAQ3PZL7_9LILI|nr:hypothetical protein Cni_G00003 [Canna indica]